jgi:hypothetical protein
LATSSSVSAATRALASAGLMRDHADAILLHLVDADGAFRVQQRRPRALERQA